MAGTTTFSKATTSTENTNRTTATNPSNIYRVTIDVPRIQANVFAMEGAHLSDLAVRNWLRSVGFGPQPDGRTWIADAETVRRLDKSEIVRAERL